MSGCDAREFEMFGVALGEREDRYAYSEEWITIVKRLWSDDGPFDFAGRHFELRGVEGKPKPYGGARLILISAGNSAVGRAFAARQADCLFMTINEIDTLADEIATVRARGKAYAVGIFASGHMICRPTAKEADEFYRYIVHEMGDWEAAKHAAVIRTKDCDTVFEALQRLKEGLISGLGTFLVIGSFDDVAAAFKRMSDWGLDGMAIGLVNYIDEFATLRDEVLPRMARLGLREPHPQGGPS